MTKAAAQNELDQTMEAWMEAQAELDEAMKQFEKHYALCITN